MKTFRIVWVRDDKKTKGILCPGPFTHEEACTVLKTFTKYGWRREMVEELD